MKLFKTAKSRKLICDISYYILMTVLIALFFYLAWHVALLDYADYIGNIETEYPDF